MARWGLESRERLPSWKMLGAGEAAWVEEAGGEGMAAEVEEAGPGRGCQVRGGCRWRGKDGEVEIVRWR